MVMVPSLRIMECHGRNKPEGTRPAQEYFMKTGKWKQTLKKWVGILLQRAGRKNTYLRLWDQNVADTKTSILFVDEFFSIVHITGISYKVVELMKKSLPFFSTWVFTWQYLKIEGLHFCYFYFFIFASKQKMC